MPAETPPFTHHLVGAVHVLTVLRDDPELTRRVLEQERSACSARRIIVDLSQIDAPHDQHLDVIRRLDWKRDLMVRLATDRPPAYLEQLPAASETTIASAS